MKVMGIDFGSKRIGVALSDENAAFAFPHSVLKNDRTFFEKICAIMREEGVQKVVIGESKDYRGNENAIMQAVHALRLRLEKEAHVEVVFEPEFLTSAEAERLQGKHEKLDASAAALILKSYLERIKQ